MLNDKILFRSIRRKLVAIAVEDIDGKAAAGIVPISDVPALKDIAHKIETELSDDGISHLLARVSMATMAQLIDAAEIKEGV